MSKEKEEKDWYSHYEHSRNARTAISVNEPSNKNLPYYYNGMTKEKAIERFSQKLGDHVEALIDNLQSYLYNEPLKKRLKKFGNSEALAALEETERILKTLPDYIS